MESVGSLTRKGATCTELLICLYDLKQTDTEILYDVARKDEATLDEIADSVKRDRSTVHRTLSKLVSLNLVYKRVKTLEEGGYYHVYSAVEEERIKDQARARVREITDGLEMLIDNFAADFHRHVRVRPQAS